MTLGQQTTCAATPRMESRRVTRRHLGFWAPGARRLTVEIPSLRSKLEARFLAGIRRGRVRMFAIMLNLRELVVTGRELRGNSIGN
jgi:hypothetical protein